uniref:Uncharacterized protein n=1 Tax=Panagrolaimus superbus TaxID=310955 RepID=A0A914Y2T7_9BILA
MEKRISFILALFEDELKQFRIEELCGRYSGFNDIPSIYWQVSTCLIAFGCLLTTTLTLILIPSCCFKHIVSKNSAIIIGLLQAVAAVCVSCGCLLYPLGWDNQEVRDACGPLSGRYFLGECQVGWAYICMLIGSALLLTCGALSICGGREPDADPQFTSYRNRFRPTAIGQPPTRYSFDAETLIDHNLRRHSLATSTGRRTSTQRIFRPLIPTSSHLPQCDV